MKHGILASVLAATVLLAVPAMAQDYTVGSLTVSGPWARASAGMAKAGATYIMQIVNNGEEADRLVGAATPAAASASLHNHTMEDGIMKMRPVKAIEIAPGEPSVLKPGGLHIMLMGLKAPLKSGETFPMTLTFEKAGALDVQVKVMKVGSMGAMDHGAMDHGAMDHGNMDHGTNPCMKGGMNPCMKHNPCMMHKH